MNTWQKIFLGIGIVSLILLGVFPPQVIGRGTVQFTFIGDGYPIDWFRLFLWVVAIALFTALGVGANKQEHS